MRTSLPARSSGFDYVHNTIINSTIISSERAEPDYVHNTIINIPSFHQREQNQIMSTTRSSTYHHFIRESRTREKQVYSNIYFSSTSLFIYSSLSFYVLPMCTEPYRLLDQSCTDFKLSSSS